MSRFGAAISVCALAVLLGVAGIAVGAGEPGPLTVKPGTLTGTLMTSSGEPLADKTLVLMQEGKAVGAVITNGRGQYVLEGLQPGSYDIIAPGAPPFRIAVTPEATTNVLTLMIPGGAAPSAAGPGAGGAADEPGLTKTQWVWIGVGAGAVAVAVPLVAAGGGGGGGGGGPVSD